MREISKNLMCICLRNGIEIWVEKEKAQRLIDLLGTTKTKFVEIGNEIINSVDVLGVFNAATMADLKMRKQGKWQCKWGTWHYNGDTCECWRLEKN